MPELLLMDEPLASLDEQRKQEFLPYLEELQENFQLPILYVSHSLAEITRLANYAVVLDHGSVSAQGACNRVLGGLANKVLDGPALDNPTSVICARVMRIDTQWRLLQCVFNGGEIWLAANNLLPIGERVDIVIAANDVSISLDSVNHTSILNCMPAAIQAITPASTAGAAMVKLQIGEAYLVAKVITKAVHQLGLTVGMKVQVQVASAKIVP